MRSEQMMEEISGRAATAGPPRIVTTSWDDGNPHDLELAEMLRARGLPGTFYVPLKGLHGSAVMTGRELRFLGAAGFEIGAHGVSHAELPDCPLRVMECEVIESKKNLEDILGAPVPMFAYPRGRHDGMVIAALKKAGYLGARTTRMLARGFGFDPFRMPTSVQAFPHPRLAYVKNLLRGFGFGRAWSFVLRPVSGRDWVSLAKSMFDSVVEKGGIWHLYGHSWEIHQHGLWDSLSDVLSYAARRRGVLYLPNHQVLSFSRKFTVHSCERATPRRTYEDSARS